MKLVGQRSNQGEQGAKIKWYWVAGKVMTDFCSEKHRKKNTSWFFWNPIDCHNIYSHFTTPPSDWRWKAALRTTSIAHFRIYLSVFLFFYFVKWFSLPLLSAECCLLHKLFRLRAQVLNQDCLDMSPQSTIQGWDLG